MTRIFLAIFAFALLSSAQAEMTTPDNEVVIIQETPNSVYQGSSEHNRINKKYEALVTPFGAGPTPGISSGVNFGYHLTRNSSYVLSYSKLTKGKSCWGDMSCSESASTIGLYYKNFFSNSFYFSVGADRRSVSYSEKMGSLPYGYDFGFDGEALSVGLLIGNQWQWNNFTIGCDWFGISVPFSHKISNEHLSGIGQSELDDAEMYYVKNVTPQALRFYLGASF